LNNNMM